MYAFDIIIKNKNPDYQYLVSDSYGYVCSLERTGQVLQGEHKVTEDKGVIKISVICPEINSLALENSCAYVLEAISRIETQSGCKIEHRLMGRDPERLSYTVPEKSSYYILRTGWSSPLICGDTNDAIPLYKIPDTNPDSKGYENIFFWAKTYEHLWGLWLNGEYEAFAQDELQNVDSKINKAGRALCVRVEELTGVPTYFFLFNSRAWSKQQDLQRKCPITGKNWLIKDSTANDFISFKCDESRLVSEFSTNCDDY